jgi:hypothetical protein
MISPVVPWQVRKGLSLAGGASPLIFLCGDRRNSANGGQKQQDHHEAGYSSQR